MDPTSLSIVPRESSTSTRLRIPSLLDSSGPVRRYKRTSFSSKSILLTKSVRRGGVLIESHESLHPLVEFNEFNMI